MPDGDLIGRFERYLKTATDTGETTQWRYAYEVRHFLKQVNKPVEDLTPGELLDWHSNLRESGAAPGTIGLKHAAVRSLLDYLKKYEASEHAGLLLDALVELKMPRGSKPKRESYALAQLEIDRILDTASNSGGGIGRRDRALIHFLWATGCRRAEVRNLLLSSLSLKERTADVIGKGQKPRPVVFDEGCKADLAAWLQDRVRWEPTCENVFISTLKAPLALTTIGVLVRDTAQRAGIEKDVWTHIFRHSRITDLLNRGMSIQDTASFVGHSSVNTTMGYFHQEKRRLKQVYDQVTK